MGIMILLSSHSPRERITQWGQPGGSGEAKACGHRPDAGRKNEAKTTPRDKSILSAEGGDAMGEYKAGFTINEASDYTGIGRNTMRNLVAWGKLPVLKVGRKVIIRRDMLEAFMEANQGRNLRNEAEVKAVRFGIA